MQSATQYGTVLFRLNVLISFDLGGEKLKPSRLYTGVLVTAIFLFFSLLTFPSYAQEADAGVQVGEALPGPERIDETTIILGDSPDLPIGAGGPSIFVVIRMVLVLALCAVAIYGVFFLVKRISRPQELKDPHLKVLARTPLSNDTFAAVISVGPKAWLVAGGSGSINLISEVNDVESLETMLIDDARRIAEADSRRYFDFSSLIKRFSVSQQKGQGGISFTHSLRKQQERLKRL